MPRPTATDSIDTSQEIPQQQQHRLNSTTNSSLILNADILNSNLSSDYHSQTPTHFVQQTSLSSTHSDDNSSNILSLSMQEQINDTTTSSSNSIPISRSNTAELNNNSNQLITTPNLSPIQSLQSTPRPAMEDKSIQCINEEDGYEDDENSLEQDEINFEVKKRSGDDDSWSVEADR
jgi:hypothetical protein